MKKHYLIGFAACTLVLASCSSKNKIDDLGGGKTDDAISFSTSVKGSRGTAIENNGNIATAGGNFGVTAFFSTGDTPPYMGTAVAGAEIVFGTSWGYKVAADARYWPDATTILDFYGYTPFTDANRKADLTFTRAGGMVFTNYEVPTDVAAQKDFMWAYTSTVKAANVAMAFNHALVRVNFKAKMVTPNMKVDIDVNGIT
ncbi:MAG: fimbrillin family protein, partial [Mucinivorans sp.]